MMLSCEVVELAIALRTQFRQMSLVSTKNGCTIQQSIQYKHGKIYKNMTLKEFTGKQKNKYINMHELAS
jgi:hypothetical protein